MTVALLIYVIMLSILKSSITDMRHADKCIIQFACPIGIISIVQVVEAQWKYEICVGAEK